MRAGVNDLVFDRHVVDATLQGVGFDEFDAADLGGFKLDRQLIHTRTERAWASHQVHHGFVGGKGCSALVGTHQACLCGVNPVFALIKQDKALGFVCHVDVVQKL